MEIKYIRCFASHNWRNLSTDVLGKLLASFVLLILKKGDEIIYETRIIIADPESKIKTVEQSKNSTKNFEKCIGLLNKFNELMPSQNNSIDIFNFNSNNDFPFFKEWLAKRDIFLNLELENMR